MKYKCDACGLEVEGGEREVAGTRFRHIPCGGRWIGIIDSFEITNVSLGKDCIAVGGRINEKHKEDK